MRLFEITRIPDYSKERDWKNFTPYWGNEDYTVHDQKGPMEVRIYENQGMIRIVGLINKQIMSYLTLMRWNEYYYRVQSIQVASEFRGKGVAPYFYNIAISDLGLTIISDDVQTRGGQGIWKKLMNNPKFHVDTVDLSTNKPVDMSTVYTNGPDNSLALRARAA